MSRDVHSCSHRLRLRIPQFTPPPRIWTRITRALLVCKDRRHLFVHVTLTVLSVHPPAKFKSCNIVCTLCRVPRSEEVTGFVVDTGRKSSKRSVSVLEGGQDAFSNGVASGENIH
jgi:hypothetical protein